MRLACKHGPYKEESPFDTLKFVEKLEAGGFSHAQAKAAAEAFAEATGQELATKSDLREVGRRLEAKIETLGANLKVDILRWLVVTQLALAGFVFAAIKFAKWCKQSRSEGATTMAASPMQIVLDAPAIDFRLPATDGRTYTFGDLAGENGTVIAFICNHCPYVVAVIDRLVADARALKQEGIGFAAICSNDAETHPDDSFPNMQRFAQAHDFPFPYLHDESQEIAKAYGAVCTPDFFGYGKDRLLKYRGRLDEGRTTPPPKGARRELLEAMRAVAVTNAAPKDQFASIGCSIKWKPD